MSQKNHLTVLDEAIKASETDRLKQILQETQHKLNQIESSGKAQKESEFVYFESIQDDDELIKHYYEILGKEPVLYSYFDLQGKIESESLQPTQKEKLHLQKIMQEASNIGSGISESLSVILKQRPKSLTSRRFNFLEMFKSKDSY